MDVGYGVCQRATGRNNESQGSGFIRETAWITLHDLFYPEQASTEKKRREGLEDAAMEQVYYILMLFSPLCVIFWLGCVKSEPSSFLG